MRVWAGHAHPHTHKDTHTRTHTHTHTHTQPQTACTGHKGGCQVLNTQWSGEAGRAALVIHVLWVAATEDPDSH